MLERGDVAERPKILIPTPTTIDLAYNHVCWLQYATAVSDAGGEAVRAELTGEVRTLERTVESCDGVLLPGSPADVSPERYGQAREEVCGLPDARREACDEWLLMHAFRERKPVLGICYGMQSINVFQGGTLLQDLACRPVNHAAGPTVGVAHGVALEGSSRLAEMAAVETGGRTARVMVNSSHHQAVGVPGDDLRVVARSSEDLMIEAVELRRDLEHFVVGVQWHPERTVAFSSMSRMIFSKLIEAAGAWRRTAVERGTIG